jgi:ankyrin repeat protein
VTEPTPSQADPEPQFLTDEPALHRAARLGDHAEIRALVARGASLDEVFDIRADPGARPVLATPLMVAAGSSSGATVETVQLLLAVGASIEPGPSGVSALSFACEGLWLGHPADGDAGRVRVLLLAGSDPNVAGSNGKTALARAAGTGDPVRIAFLLSAGADPNPEVDQDFKLPVFEAVRSDVVECVELIVAAGADVNAFGQWGNPILATATSAEMVAFLLAAGADPRARGYKGTAIAEELACRGFRTRDDPSERVTMLRLLIEAGADIDGPSIGGTALEGAVRIGSARGAEVLLEVGADPWVDDLLLEACFSYGREGDDEWQRVIDLLVGVGYDANRLTKSPFPPLLHALQDESYREVDSDGINVPVALALIRHGASVDVTFPDTGYRPLHAAAAAGSAVLIEALLAAGASPSDRSSDGRTPDRSRRRSGLPRLRTSASLRNAVTQLGSRLRISPRARGRGYQPWEPGPPLKGPTTASVTQPP